MKLLLITCSIFLATTHVFASETLVDEPDGKSYNFVSHYSVEIDASANTVWKHLIDLGSWMHDFEMDPISGLDKLEGRVFRLYEGQDFRVQITKAIPGELLVIANLPTSMEGERLTSGISVTTLTEREGRTTVRLTMSRRYVWTGQGENHLKARRQSDAFIHNTRAMWASFLGRLAELSTTSADTGL